MNANGKTDARAGCEALSLLGQKAAETNVELEMCIYGGSAMMLAYS